MSIKIMSFNLRHAGLGDGPNEWIYRRDAAANLIRQLLPDILGTQETTSEMLQDLQERLPEYDFVGVGRGGKLNGESASIFFCPAKLQIVAAGHFWLSHEPLKPGSRLPEVKHQRMCTWVRFRMRDTSVEFEVYNTNLDHRHQFAREHGAKMIREHIIQKQAFEQLPTIVMGDMNAKPDNKAINLLLASADGQHFMTDAADWLRQQGIEVSTTFHGFKEPRGNMPIDYILHTAGFETASFRVYTEQVDGRYPSDHYPIVADLKVKS